MNIMLLYFLYISESIIVCYIGKNGEQLEKLYRLKKQPKCVKSKVGN